MNDFEKIEHLLLSKRFEELSPAEVKEVNGYFENAGDYNDMRDTLMQVKSTLAADKLLIKPSVDLKEKLLQKFDATYTNQTSKGGGKTRPFYKNIRFQWAAAASVVILISLSIFGYINNLGGEKSKDMAVNYEKPNSSPVDETYVSPTNDGVIVTEEESKEKVTDLKPNGWGEQEDLDGKKKLVIDKNSNVVHDEIMEGDEISNAPTSSNNESQLGIGTLDNTTLGGVNTNLTKEERKDADYFLNDRVLTNAYKDDNNTKINDSKNGELNTTIPTNSQSQSLGNTTTLVNKDKEVNKKQYWNNKKKNKTKTDSNKGKLENNAPLTNDSLITKTDSVKVDSNKNLMQNNGDIQMEDNKKKDE